MTCDHSFLIRAAGAFRFLPKSEISAAKIYLLCQWANHLTPAFCQHAVVDAWVTRVGLNGGTTTGLQPGGTIYDALCQFMTGMDTAGLTAKMIAVMPMVPGQVSPAVAAGDLTRALTPLIANFGNNPWTNVGNNFVPGDLRTSGLTSNGVNKALATGIIATAALPNDNSGGISLYNMTAANLNAYDIGGRSAAGSTWTLINSSFPNAAFYECWNETNGQGRLTAANALWRGFLSGNRIAANSADIYRANSFTPLASIVHGAGAPIGTRPTHALSAYCLNNGGANANFTAREISFWAVHQGLTQAECTSFFTLVQALRTALGGGYV